MKKKMHKREKKRSKYKLDQGGNLDTILSKKVKVERQARRDHQNNSIMHTITSSKKSVRVSRYSNVNIAMLNSMRSNETQQGEELEMTLSKQTKLETRVSILTIKRTLICFFSIVFGIPFFISTTYKAWLSEFIPIAKMMEDTRVKVSASEYKDIMDFFVENHKNDYDRLVGLKGPGYEWKAEDWINDEIRELELIETKDGEYTFTVDLNKSIKLYSI